MCAIHLACGLAVSHCHAMLCTRADDATLSVWFRNERSPPLTCSACECRATRNAQVGTGAHNFARHRNALQIPSDITAEACCSCSLVDWSTSNSKYCSLILCIVPRSGE